ncbi:hypothetical protein ACIBQ5_02340 [Streptomyces massasporeus]|nr:hypothetical protein [Streptomyces sp. AK010]MBB6419686.1 hypothetical protein [Streptomyces sp. AK010]
MRYAQSAGWPTPVVTIPGAVFILADEAPRKTAEVIAAALAHTA